MNRSVMNSIYRTFDLFNPLSVILFICWLWARPITDAPPGVCTA